MCTADRKPQWGPPGLAHDTPRAQTCTFEGSGASKHHQNSTRRPPRKKEKKFLREREKSKILGGLAEGRPTERPKNLEDTHQKS